MAFLISYNTLFSVNIVHKYFLNKGIVEFSSLTVAEQKKQLDLYNIHNVFDIHPSNKTVQVLNGHQLVFKKESSGFSVWSKVAENDKQIPFISFADDLKFTFLLGLKDRLFYNYTNLSNENSGLFYFSNQRMNTESPTFPLIKLLSETDPVNEGYKLSLDGMKKVLAGLETTEKNNLFGVIEISIKGANSSLNITGVDNKIQTPHKTFGLLFTNRKTTWRYLFSENQKVKNNDDVVEENGNTRQLVTKTEQPFTQNGFISIELDGKELPNPLPTLIHPDTSNKYYSEIYM